MTSNTFLFTVFALASISAAPACTKTSASAEPPSATSGAHGGHGSDAQPMTEAKPADTVAASAGTPPDASSTEPSTATAAAPHGDGHSDHGAAPEAEPATPKAAAAKTPANPHDGMVMTKTPEAPKSAGQQAATGGASGSTSAATNPHDGMAMTATLSVANGATVAAGLSQIDIAFDHPMSLKSASLKSFAGDTIPVKLPPSGETSKASVTFAGLEADTYTFTWRAKAGDHDMSGSARFTVN